jgi:hypothetical protein
MRTYQREVHSPARTQYVYGGASRPDKKENNEYDDEHEYDAVLYARVVPATDMVKTMRKYHEDDANKEEGREEEEDNGESDVLMDSRRSAKSLSLSRPRSAGTRRGSYGSPFFQS